MNPEHADAPGAREQAWLGLLRERFVRVARRRVTPDVVEDVVQDALRIVVERGIGRPGATTVQSEPALAACFQVLRNVIGNHYQKRRTEQRRREPLATHGDRPDPAPGPLAALSSEEIVSLVRRCLTELAVTDPGCARYLARLADGHSPREVAGEEALEEAVFYRRVYRCRLKLRALLERRGVFA